METEIKAGELLPMPGRGLEEGFRDFAESLVQQIDEVFFWRDPNVIRPYFVSNAYERIWGRPCESAYDEPSSWIESIHPADRDLAMRQLEQDGASGRSQAEYRIIRPDGEVRWVWVRTFPFRDDAGEIRRLIGIAQDYTERKQFESTQAFLASIVESSDDSIIGSDLEGKIVSWNHGAERLFGYTPEEAIGRPVTILFPPNQELNYLKTVLNTVGRLEETRRFEAVRMAKSGTPIEVSVILSPIRDTTGQPQGLSGIYRDIRDRKSTERQREIMEVELRHAQKLESVGHLAAGVAHEINTPIQFVSDSVYFVRDALKDVFNLIGEYQTMCEAAAGGANVEEKAVQIARVEQDLDLRYLLEQVPKAVERALDGMDRVAVIVRSMKEFAHPDQAEKTPVDLNRAITSTLTMARNEYKYVAVLETEFGDIPSVTCHVGQINQVILNIVVNAAHAITDVVAGTEQRGRIRVRTWREEDEAVITIEDTGAGIPDEIRDRIFDPFFTTKEVGRGTGQGLAIARSVIVDKHGGTIDFESEVGCGTTFLIRLPVDGNSKRPTQSA
jgi:two-component system NtrC family sensor kinase